MGENAQCGQTGDPAVIKGDVCCWQNEGRILSQFGVVAQLCNWVAKAAESAASVTQWSASVGNYSPAEQG